MKTALTIDDEPTVCKSVKLILGRHGFETFAAHDLASTRNCLARVNPSVIILDVDLGYENGFDLCEIIRSDYEELRCPIVFLSGGRGVMDVREARAAGGDYYVVKPYTEESLVTGIKKAIHIRRAAIEGSVAN